MLPYWSFWEASAGGSALRMSRSMLASEIATKLSTLGFEVAWHGLIDSVEVGARAGQTIAQLDIDTVIVVQTMAAPPIYASAVVEELDVPIVVWALQFADRLDDAFNESDITQLGATVGTPMLTNVMHRQGRPHTVVVGHLSGSFEKLCRTIVATATAHAVRNANLLRIGSVLDGYDCVDVDEVALRAAIGITVVRVSPTEFQEHYAVAPAEIVDDIETEMVDTFQTDAAALPTRRRAARLAAALASLDEDLNVSAGAMNCHVNEIRFGEDPGITPCFALGRETTRGIPWTCVGDVITAVAMLIGKRLGGAALYHEVEAIDFAVGEVVLANSGEHDLAWCPAEVRPRLVANRWFAADPLTGVAAWFELPPGPATMIGFTPTAAESSGFRIIAAEGVITDRSFPNSPTVAGSFRFAGDSPVDVVWGRWVDAGVNHHSCLSPGALADQVEIVARQLGIGFVKVS